MIEELEQDVADEFSSKDDDAGQDMTIVTNAGVRRMMWQVVKTFPSDLVEYVKDRRDERRARAQHGPQPR
jgi:hypothetical protein